ncbi:hypothetical protein Hanom_Chr01g00081891 [Helianthus anomalus]
MSKTLMKLFMQPLIIFISRHKLHPTNLTIPKHKIRLTQIQMKLCILSFLIQNPFAIHHLFLFIVIILPAAH